jgi:hypothetical protein
MGFKLAQRIWREPAKELRRHADLIKQDPSAYLKMQNMLNRNTDGPDNPLSQVFSQKSARQLFSQFQAVRTEIMFWNPNWLPGLGKLIPRFLEDKLAARWGWHLWIYGQKPPQWNAPRIRIQKPSHIQQQVAAQTRMAWTREVPVASDNPVTACLGSP